MKKLFTLLMLLCICVGGWAVDYTVKLNGSTIGTKTAESKEALQATLPNYINYEWDGDILNTSYKSGVLPFEIGKVYIIFFYNGGHYYWNDDNSGQANEVRDGGNPKDISNRAELENFANTRWTMGGDWLNGFKFINADTNKFLYSNATSISTSFSLHASNATAFDPVKQRNNYWRFYIHGQTAYFIAHTSHNTHRVAMYNTTDYGITDEGGASCVRFEEDNYTSSAVKNLLEAIDNNKVGYPVKDDAAFSDILSTLRTMENTSSVTLEQYNKYKSALAYTTVNLPKDGKAYYLVNYQMRATNNYQLYGKWMMKYNENHTLGTEYYTGQEPNENNIFICRQVGEKFTFVTKDGYYLRHYSGDHAGSLSETYDANQLLTIQKHTKESSYVFPENEKYSGLLAIRGNRNGTANACIIVNGSNGYYDNTSGMLVRNQSPSNQYSTAWRLIEVDNPNTIKLTNPNKEAEKKTLLDKRYVGTFSAPYAVKLRDGVEAYIASVSNDVVTFTKLGAGNIVPKNTGVMLYAPDAQDNITEPAIPAIETVNMTGSNNAFVGSNAGSVVMQSDYYYVLGKKEAGVGFYPAVVESTLARNKAYLDLSQHPQVSAFRFDFEGDGITTDISSVMGLNKQNEGVAYDLAGRRCNTNAKGISIVGGKKVIR